MEEGTPLATDYVASRHKAAGAAVLERLKKKYVPPPVAAEPVEPPKPAKPEEGTLSAIAKDVTGGLGEIKGAMWAGLNNAVTEFGDNIAGVFGVDLNKLNEDVLDLRYSYDKPDTVTGGLIESATQFVAGMVPAAKALKVTGLAGVLGRPASAVAVGALADVAAFDEHADRLADLAMKVPGLDGPMTQWLAGDEDDGVLEGKMKQAIEGAGLGALGEGVIAGARVVKRVVQTRKGLPPEALEGAVRKRPRMTAEPEKAPEPEKPLFQVEGAPTKPQRLVMDEETSHAGGALTREYRWTDESGGNLATIEARVQGDTIWVENVVGPTAEGKTPVNALGPRQMRDLAAELATSNPDAKWLMGRRTSGARHGGQGVDLGEGVEARIDLSRFRRSMTPVPQGHAIALDIPTTHHADPAAFGAAVPNAPKGATAVTVFGRDGPEVHVGPDFTKLPPAEQATVLAHEQGHAIWERMEKAEPWFKRDMPPELFAEMETLSRQARKHLWEALDKPGSKAHRDLLKRSPWLADDALPKYLRESRELAADAFSVYRTNPELARQQAPKAAAFFDAAVQKYGSGTTIPIKGIPEPEAVTRALFASPAKAQAMADTLVSMRRPGTATGRSMDDIAQDIAGGTRAYHGTGEDFDAFDPAKIGTATDTGDIGRGFYFTAKPEHAAAYAKKFGERGRVMEVTLDVKNPLRSFDADFQKAVEARVAVKRAAGTPQIVETGPLKGWGEMDAASPEMHEANWRATAISEEAQARGYDAIMAKNPRFGYDEIVIFDPAKIRKNAPPPELGKVKIAGKVGNINLRRFETADDVLDVIRQTAEMVPIEATVRQSTEEARALADQLLMSPDKMRELLEGRSALGRAVTREEVIATGELVAQNGRGIDDLAKKIVAGKATDEEKVGLGQAMALQEALLRTISGQAKEAGRALQAFKTGVGNSKLSGDAIRELLAEGDVDRLAATIAAMDGDLGRLNGLAKGSAWKNIGNAIYESWMGSKFLNPWTHARNVVGNSLSLFGQIPERAFAAGIGKVTGGGGVVPGEATEMLFGLMYGFKEAMSAGWTGFKTGLASDRVVKAETKLGGSGNRRAISAAKLGFDENSPVGKAVNFYGEWVNGLGFRALTGNDEFTKSLARRMQLGAMAMRTATKEGLKGDALRDRVTELITSPPGWMTQETVDFAQHITFQEKLGQATTGMKMIRSSTPLGRYIVPFIQTPANILKFSAARTPIAGVTPAFWRDVAAGGAKRDLALAKISLGSIVSAGMAHYLIDDRLTGSPPGTPAVRAAWARQGKLPYSIRIGDRWIQYNQMEPLGLMLGFSADVAQIMERSDDVRGLAASPERVQKAYQDMIAGGSTPEEAQRRVDTAVEMGEKGFNQLPGMVVQLVQYNLLEKSYLQSLSDLSEVMNAPSLESAGAKGQEFMARFVAGFVPLDSTWRFLERIADPEIREAKGVVEAIKAMTPGLSDDLPSIPNLWGDERVSSLAQFPFAFGAQIATGSPIDAELERIGYGPSMPEKTLHGVRLTADDYIEYVKLAGNGLKMQGLGAKGTLDAIVTGRHPMSKAYARGSDGPDGGKAHVVRTVIEAFRKAAGAQMLKNHHELRILAQETMGAKASLTAPPTLQ